MRLSGSRPAVAPWPVVFVPAIHGLASTVQMSRAVGRGLKGTSRACELLPRKIRGSDPLLGAVSGGHLGACIMLNA